MRYFLIVASLCCFSVTSFAAEYESFTEPDKEILLAAPEIDVLTSIKVKAGDTVKAGETVAILDNRVYAAGLEVADAKRKATSRINAARAIEKLRQEKLNRLVPLLASGNAQQYEVTEARIELESAAAESKAAQETLRIDSLEYEQIRAQVERRILRSPIDGVVTVVKKEVAELVGGNDAHIMTIARINPLKTTIHVPTAEALKFKVGQSMQVRFVGLELPNVSGKISTISPITDASSDTVKIEVQMDNPQSKLRSGVKCVVTPSP